MTEFQVLDAINKAINTYDRQTSLLRDDMRREMRCEIRILEERIYHLAERVSKLEPHDHKFQCLVCKLEIENCGKH